MKKAIKTCLFRITEEDRLKLEALLFRRYPIAEWGTFFTFGYRATPWGMHVTFVEQLEPRSGDLDEKSGIVEFNARYILRAQLHAEGMELGIGVIHSHPQDCGTGASPLDNDMDRYFSTEFARCTGGRPYLSLRVARDYSRAFSFSGEAWTGSEVLPVTQYLTVGKTLLREFAQKSTDTGVTDVRRARLAELIGNRVGRLTNAIVGIVGCSGLGSPAIHALVRAGVRRFVLVDPDVFSPSNLERFHGSTWRDVEGKPLKLEIVHRLITDIEPEAEITLIRGNVLHDVVLDELLRCDLVLGCTDSQHGRAALGDLAVHYLLPCIDAAVLMRAKDGVLTEQVGELARYTAHEACSWCLGRINQKALTYELLSEEERTRRAQAAAEAIERGVDGGQYWGGTPPKELTVGYMTTVVGAMQAGYALGWLTGSSQMPHQRFQFDLGMPLLGVVPAGKPRRPECSCGCTKGWSDQARSDRSVTLPPHWGPAEVIGR